MGADLSIFVYASCYYVLITQDTPLQLYYVVEYNFTGPNLPDYYEPTRSLLLDLNSPGFPDAYNGTQPSRYYTKDAVPFTIGPFSIFETLNMVLTLNDDTLTVFTYLLDGNPLVTPLCTDKYNGTCVVRNKIVDNISGFCGDYSYCNGREYCNVDNGRCMHPGQTCSLGSCCLDNISLGFGGYTTGRCYNSNECATSAPTRQSITRAPTSAATPQPTALPTNLPTGNPTPEPTIRPTNRPTEVPTSMSSAFPTNTPILPPTSEPTGIPTSNTRAPTFSPTLEPTGIATPQPTALPTNSPTPTNQPTVIPTPQPTILPTNNPIETQTNQPTGNPTPEPTIRPTEAPISMSSAFPTNIPTTPPTDIPTATTVAPTNLSTNSPTTILTAQPTGTPTPVPTNNPTSEPTNVPVLTSPPTNSPTILHTSAPGSVQPTTGSPTTAPTGETPPPSVIATLSPINQANNGGDGNAERNMYGILLVASITILLVCIRFSSVRRSTSIV